MPGRHTILNGVSAISSSVHRLEIAISSFQSRLLSLSNPPAAPTIPTVAQTLDVSLWTSAIAEYDPLYSAEVAEQLCREHGLEPFAHSVTTFAAPDIAGKYSNINYITCIRRHVYVCIHIKYSNKKLM